MAMTDDILTVLAPPHPAGRPFIMGGLIAILLGFGIGHWLIWLGLIFTLFCLYFFRDPERVPPPRPGVFVAPADGRVVSVTQAAPPPELGLGRRPSLARIDLPVGAERARQPRSGDRCRHPHRLPAWRLRQRQPGQGQQRE